LLAKKFENVHIIAFDKRFRMEQTIGNGEVVKSYNLIAERGYENTINEKDVCKIIVKKNSPGFLRRESA